MCSLSDNLHSNVWKVHTNKLEGQKMTLHWQISAFHDIGPPTIFSKSMYIIWTVFCIKCVNWFGKIWDFFKKRLLQISLHLDLFSAFKVAFSARSFHQTGQIYVEIRINYPIKAVVEHWSLQYIFSFPFSLGGGRLKLRS